MPTPLATSIPPRRERKATTSTMHCDAWTGWTNCSMQQEGRGSCDTKARSLHEPCSSSEGASQWSKDVHINVWIQSDRIIAVGDDTTLPAVTRQRPNSRLHPTLASLARVKRRIR
jgi:hypothetical protein